MNFCTMSSGLSMSQAPLYDRTREYSHVDMVLDRSRAHAMCLNAKDVTMVEASLYFFDVTLGESASKFLKGASALAGLCIHLISRLTRTFECLAKSAPGLCVLIEDSELHVGSRLN